MLVSTAFLGDRWKQSPLASHWEQELSLQVHSAATSIQVSPGPLRAGMRSLWRPRVAGLQLLLAKSSEADEKLNLTISGDVATGFPPLLCRNLGPSRPIRTLKGQLFIPF